MLTRLPLLRLDVWTKEFGEGINEESGCDKKEEDVPEKVILKNI